MCLIGHQASWDSKYGKVLVIQNLGHGVGHLIFSDVHLYESHKVIYDDEDILCLRFLSQITRQFHLNKVDMN